MTHESFTARAGADRDRHHRLVAALRARSSGPACRRSPSSCCSAPLLGPAGLGPGRAHARLARAAGDRDARPGAGAVQRRHRRGHRRGPPAAAAGRAHPRPRHPAPGRAHRARRLGAARPPLAGGRHPRRGARLDRPGAAPHPDPPSRASRRSAKVGAPARERDERRGPAADRGAVHAGAARPGGARRPGRSAAARSGSSCSGPLLGVFAGWVAITLLDQVRRRVGVRRDYESLYALGVAFTAFARPRRWAGAASWRRSRRGSSSRRSTSSCATASSTTARRRRRCSCCSPSWRSGRGSSGPASRVAGDWRVLLFAVMALGVRTAGAGAGAGALGARPRRAAG